MSPKPEEFVLTHVREMQAYVPGFQPEEAKQNFIKLNTNESPFPPSPAVVAALKRAIEADCLQLYPDPRSLQLRRAIAHSYHLSAEHVLIGNGSDELLSILFRALLAPGDSLLGCDLSYSLYPVLAQGLGAKLRQVPLQADWRMDFNGLKQTLRAAGGSIKLAVLANPNAPTSVAEPLDDILALAKENPALTLIDEAYAPFVGMSLGNKAGSDAYPRLLVCGSFSKAYSLAGQRIGWLLAQPDLIAQLDKLRDSYNVSYLAQTAALSAWEDQSENERRIQIILKNRKILSAGLAKLGFMSLPASANFIFTRPPPKIGSAEKYAAFLASRKILVRHFPQAGRASAYLRITVGKEEDMQRLLRVSEEWCRL